jgi:hypothetical protein
LLRRLPCAFTVRHFSLLSYPSGLLMCSCWVAHRWCPLSPALPGRECGLELRFVDIPDLLRILPHRTVR